MEKSKLNASQIHTLRVALHLLFPNTPMWIDALCDAAARDASAESALAEANHSVAVLSHAADSFQYRLATITLLENAITDMLNEISWFVARQKNLGEDLGNGRTWADVLNDDLNIGRKALALSASAESEDKGAQNG